MCQAIHSRAVRTLSAIRHKSNLVKIDFYMGASSKICCFAISYAKKRPWYFNGQALSALRPSRLVQDQLRLDTNDL